MDRSVGDVQFLTRDDEQSLQRRARHGRSRLMHALGQGLRVVFSSTHVGKDKEWMPVKGPVTAQFLVQARGQRHDPILMSLAIADEEFVLRTLDVVNRQGQAFAQSQPTGVDEFDRSSVTPQANVRQKLMHLLACQHSGQDIVVLGAHLAKNRPVGVTEEVDKELP